MTGQVRANTDDLHTFFTHGDGYNTALDSTLESVAAAQATVRSATGHSVSTDSAIPFRELIAKASVNTAFVEGIYVALVNYGDDIELMTFSAVEPVDQTLAEAGLSEEDIVFDEGAEGTPAEQLRRAAEIAGARGDTAEQQSLLEQAGAAQKYEDLVAIGVDRRAAAIVAGGPAGLFDSVQAGEMNPLVAAQIPTLEPWLQDQIISGDMSYADARNLDWSGLAEHEGLQYAVTVGDLSVEDAKGMRSFSDGLIDDVLDGEVSLELASEISEAGPASRDAASDGDYTRAALLTLDSEVQSSHTLGTYFDTIFDDDKVENFDDELAALAQEGGMDGVRERLQSDLGLEGVALEEAVGDIERAIAFYTDPENAEAYVALDDAHDGNPDNDNIAQAGDAILRTAHLTFDSDSAAGQLVRADAIESHIINEGPVNFNTYALVDEFNGEGWLGELTPTDQETLIGAFVSVNADLALSSVGTDTPVGSYTAGQHLETLPLLAREQREDNPRFHELVAEATTEKAIDLQFGSPDDYPSTVVAAMLSSAALDLYTPEERADFIVGLDGTRTAELPDGTTIAISESALFADALALEDRFPEELGNEFYFDQEVRAKLVQETILAIDDQAGLILGPGESNFVTTVFATAPADLYAISNLEFRSGEDWTYDTPFTVAMANLLAINAYPSTDTDDLQEAHADRLHRILRSPEALAVLANGNLLESWDLDYVQPVDGETRRRLITTTLFGRYEDESLDSDVEFWTDEDFRNGGVVADFNVDVAREIAFTTTGQPLGAGDESRIREIAAADFMKDDEHQLYGFQGDITFDLRAQLLHLAMEENWDASVITDTTNGWESETINEAYLSLIAQVNLNGNEPLSDEQRAAILEVFETENGRAALGLRSEFVYPDMVRILQQVVEGNWTSDTFNDEFGDGNLMLNSALNDLFAQDAWETYSPDGVIGSQLVGLEENTSAYVFTALQIDPLGGENDLGVIAANKIVDAIGEEYPDGHSVQVVPIQLNVGNGQRATVFLFQVLDSAGNEMGLVDQDGRHYNDAQEWQDKAHLGKAGITAPTVVGGPKVSDLTFGYGDTPGFHTFKSEDFDGPGIIDHIFTGVGVVGGVVVILGTGGWATPIGYGMIVTSAGYQVVGSIEDLHDYGSTGGSLSFSDPYARGAWINIGTNTLSIAAAGSSALASQGVRGFSVIGANGVPQATTAVTRLNTVNDVVGNLNDAFDAWGIISDDSLTSEQKWQALGVMGLWAAPGFLANQYVSRQGMSPSGNGPDVSNPPDVRVGPGEPLVQGVTEAEFVRLRDQSFDDFWTDYKDEYPTGTLSRADMRARYDQGERINPNRVPKYIQTTEAVTVSAPQLDGQVTFMPLPDAYPGFDNAAAARTAANMSPYMKSVASQALGEAGGEIGIVNFVENRFGSGAEILSLDGQPIDTRTLEGSFDSGLGGTGQFDQAVLVVVDGQTFVLINEAKGGQGQFSTRNVDGVDYEQGTYEHTHSTLEQMQNTDPEGYALIQDAITNGTLIYTNTRVVLDPAGNVTQIRINEFDVSGYPADPTVATTSTTSGFTTGTAATTPLSLSGGPITLADSTPFAVDPRLTAEQQAQVADYSTFETAGMDRDSIDHFLNETPEGEAMLDAATAAAGPGTSTIEIYNRVVGWLESGQQPATAVPVNEPLVKIVPSGDSVSSYSPYFTPLSTLEAANAQGVSLADYLGLPAGSHAPEYDLFVIMPTGEGAVGFESTIAPTSELDGLIQTEGGGTQVIIPDRSQFTAPVRIATLPESGPLPEIDLPDSVWDMQPMNRGTAVHNTAAANEYSNWDQPGRSQFESPVTIDFVRNDTVVALVSAQDPRSVSHLQTEIGNLAATNYEIEVAPGVVVDAEVVLDLRVPAGRADGFTSLIEFGRDRGVTVQIVEVR